MCNSDCCLLAHMLNFHLALNAGWIWYAAHNEWWALTFLYLHFVGIYWEFQRQNLDQNFWPTFYFSGCSGYWIHCRVIFFCWRGNDPCLLVDNAYYIFLSPRTYVHRPEICSDLLAVGGENPPYLKLVWYVNEDLLHVFFKGGGGWKLSQRMSIIMEGSIADYPINKPYLHSELTTWWIPRKNGFTWLYSCIWKKLIISRQSHYGWALPFRFKQASHCVRGARKVPRLTEWSVIHYFLILDQHIEDVAIRHSGWYV